MYYLVLTVRYFPYMILFSSGPVTEILESENRESPNLFVFFTFSGNQGGTVGDFFPNIIYQNMISNVQ